MSISTYDELKSAVADYLNRDDLTTVIPTFISIAESQISRDLRHWRQQRRVSTSLDEQFENLPTDFIEAVHLYINTNDGEKTLEFASKAEINRRKQSAAGTAGEPVVFTINSNQFEVVPVPDESYDLTLIYYAQIPGLSDAEPDNWLLSYFPDIYLYGALVHSAPYLAEDERLTMWAQLYAAAVKQANSESNMALYSGGPLVMRNK